MTTSDQDVPARPAPRRSAGGTLLGVGVLLELLVGMFPAAMVGAAEAQCNRTRPTGFPEWECLQSAPTWVEYAREGPGGAIFEHGSANFAFVVGVILAALIIPAGLGLVVRRWRWVVFAGLAAECSVPVGFAIGAAAASYFWPHIPADRAYAVLGLIFGPLYALVLALPFAVASAAVGTWVVREFEDAASVGWLVLGIALGGEGLILWALIGGLDLGVYP